MLQKIDGLGYQSTLLSIFHGVIHGFSVRSMGDMKNNKKNRESYSHMLGTSTPPVLAEQVHGSLMGLVDGTVGDVVSGVDGLVSRGISIAVTVADCVPVLLFDPSAHICAVAHAGWQGTLGGIITNAVDRMVECGASLDTIVACIGPHIGACCYNVSEERAKKFLDTFGQEDKLAMLQNDGRWHLDIGWANYRQLLDSGVVAHRIDAPPICTSCQNDSFFSYRKDTKDTFGEIMGIIEFR